MGNAIPGLHLVMLPRTPGEADLPVPAAFVTSTWTATWTRRGSASLSGSAGSVHSDMSG